MKAAKPYNHQTLKGTTLSSPNPDRANRFKTANPESIMPSSYRQHQSSTRSMPFARDQGAVSGSGFGCNLQQAPRAVKLQIVAR